MYKRSLSKTTTAFFREYTVNGYPWRHLLAQHNWLQIHVVVRMQEKHKFNTMIPALSLYNMFI